MILHVTGLASHAQERCQIFTAYKSSAALGQKKSGDSQIVCLPGNPSWALLQMPNPQPLAAQGALPSACKFVPTPWQLPVRMTAPSLTWFYHRIHNRPSQTLILPNCDCKLFVFSRPGPSYLIRYCSFLTQDYFHGVQIVKQYDFCMSVPYQQSCSTNGSLQPRFPSVCAIGGNSEARACMPHLLRFLPCGGHQRSQRCSHWIQSVTSFATMPAVSVIVVSFLHPTPSTLWERPIRLSKRRMTWGKGLQEVLNGVALKDNKLFTGLVSWSLDVYLLEAL